MCYSKDISKTLFIVNVITCLILYNTNNSTAKIFSLFFLFVGFMQLFDWIFWDNQNICNKQQANINFIFTKIAMIFNHLQPIILGLLIYMYKDHISPNSFKMLLLYSAAMIIYTINTYSKIDYTLVKTITTFDGEQSALYWQWNEQQDSTVFYILFLVTLTVLGYDNFSYPMNYIAVFVNLASFAFSKFYFKGNTVGRVWCKIAAALPLLMVLIASYKK
jgi:hypothetical protein